MVTKLLNKERGCRFLSGVLIIALVVSSLSGCGSAGPTATVSNPIQGTLSAQNLKVGENGVSIEVSPICIDQDTAVTITPQMGLPPVGEIAVNAYDFHVDVEELAGVIQITLPYDQRQLGTDLKPEDRVAAAYFNQESQAWENVVFDVNPSENSVTITTDHLSIYGVFVISKEYTKEAYIEFVSPKTAMRSEAVASEYAEVISETISQNMIPGNSALELGNKVVGNWFNFSGVLTTLSAPVYGSEIVNGLSGAMTNLGLLSAVAQVAVDYSNGDDALYGNLIKNLGNFAVSKWGSSILQLGNVGVFFIDYSLNKFIETALAGRKDIYSEAYRMYYSQDKVVKRTAKDWYRIILPLAREAKTPTELNNKIMSELDRYCGLFWADDTVVAFYQGEAQKGGFTGLGGLNPQVQAEISREHKYELLQGTLQPVFSQIGRKLTLEQEDKLNDELWKIAKQLNQSFKLRIFDSVFEEDENAPEKAQYAGYVVRVANLANVITDKNEWEAVIDDEGQATIDFTLIAHMLAGSPSKLELVSPKDDEVVKEYEFIVGAPEFEIDTADGTAIGGISFVSGTGNTLLGFGIISALQEMGTVPVGEGGAFSITVPMAATVVPSGKDKYNVEVTNLLLEGQWDKKGKTGSAKLTCVAHSIRNDRDDLTDTMGYEELYFRTTYDYTDMAVGSGDITLEGEQLVLDLDIQYNRSGFTKLVRVAVEDGETKVGENPTVTDKSGSFTTVGKYRFTIK